LSGSEEDTYSIIFTSLKHPIRRRILRILSDEPQTFSELQKLFMIESSHLTYHLEGLGNLLLKTQDGKYALSSLGEAAVSTMTHVEEPSKVTPHIRFPPKTWKLLMTAMLIGLILLSTLLIFEYQSSTGLSARYSSLSEELNVLEKGLRDYLGGTVTDEQTINGTIATALLQKEGSTIIFLDLENGNTSSIENVTVFNATTPWGHNIDNLTISSLTENCTLKIKIILNSSHPQDPLHVTIDESWNAPNQTEYSPESYFHLWDQGVTGNTTFSVSLPSERRYTVWIEAPAIWDTDGHHETSYVMTLSMESESSSVPFIVGNQEEEASSGQFLTMTSATTPLLLSHYPYSLGSGISAVVNITYPTP
jgi:DNA-binding transcriptional ArsR family regulator